ncbi:MAG: hypothetical protein WDN66_02145 [Candidatus Saccharibacteria bacterium]
MQKTVKQYKKSRLVLLLSAIVEGAISYGFISLSIDRGNLWWYLLAIIFLVGTLKNLIRLIVSFTPYGRKAT